MNIEATAKQIMSARHSDAFNQEACEQILEQAFEALHKKALYWQDKALGIAQPKPESWQREKLASIARSHAAQPQRNHPQRRNTLRESLLDKGIDCDEVVHSTSENKPPDQQPQRSEGHAITEIHKGIQKGLSDARLTPEYAKEGRELERSDQPPSSAKATDDKQKEWTPEYLDSFGADCDCETALHNATKAIKAALDAEKKETARWVVEAHESAKALAAEQSMTRHFEYQLRLRLEELDAERQRREQAERELGMVVDWRDQLSVTKEQLLSALAAIKKHNKEHHPWTDGIRFIDLSALREHDADLWKLLIDGKPRAICKACGYPELIGSDDCRNCGKNFNERIEFGEKHDEKLTSEVRKPLVDLLEIYIKAMDAIYNHNEASRRTVVTHFGTTHPKSATDALAKVKE